MLDLQFYHNYSHYCKAQWNTYTKMYTISICFKSGQYRPDSWLWIFPTQGSSPRLLMSPALAGRVLSLAPPGKPINLYMYLTSGLWSTKYMKIQTLLNWSTFLVSTRMTFKNSINNENQVIRKPYKLLKRTKMFSVPSVLGSTFKSLLLRYL